MRRLIVSVITLLMTSLTATVGAQNLQQGDYGYLYCHMSDKGEWTAFALSRDGYHYQDLIGGLPVFNTERHARIEGGTRDAYITRKHDGSGYVMVTTDMCVAKSRVWDNYGIDLLQSDDLIHWTSVTFDYRQGPKIFCDSKSKNVYKNWSAINRVWAPQIFWDPDYRWANGQRGGYLIYYSMLNRAEEKYDRMYYSYADESFTRLTKPQLLFDWGYATIDADINYLESDGLYHMLIKKEGGKPGIYTATSKYLTKGWGNPVEDDYVSFEGDKKCEGSSAFQLIGDDTWRVAYIQYSDRPKHYRICKADKYLRNFSSPVDIEGVTGPQHGSFMRLTKEEYERLEAWSDSIKRHPQTVSVTIENPTDIQRQQLVEVELSDIQRRLDISGIEPFVVRNAIGQKIDYQKTHDGKLIFEASVHPKGKATFTVSRGFPREPKAYVKGRLYKERKDDIAWENDRSAYRVYGPALQQSGERSFGVDVWTKSTPELVVEHRYSENNRGWWLGDSLRKAGHPDEAREAHLTTSFHLDHGDGLDGYGVGPSLGCGTPALMRDGQLVFPYCYKDFKILDNGPLRFTVELTYNTDADGVTEHRIISLDKGSHFNKMTVWYDGIKKPTTLAAGVVLHGDDHLVLGKDYVQYADPTDNPKAHQSQIYVATLFPEGVSETTLLKGELNHGIGIVRDYKGGRYTYYFGSAWSNYDIRTQAQWQLYIDEYLVQLRNPLSVSLD